jgi:hypothetical protein
MSFDTSFATSDKDKMVAFGLANRLVRLSE